MRRYLGILAAIVGLMPINGVHAQEQALKIATEGAYPPFTSVDPSGKIVGWDIDIGDALCEEMKVKCEYIAQDWNGLIPGLNAGKFDAINSTMAITPERAKQVDFTNKYYSVVPAIIARKDAGIKGISPKDLAGKTLGVQGGSMHDSYSTKTYTESNIRRFPSSENLLLDLASGRLEAINDDAVFVQPWLDSTDGACCEVVQVFKPVLDIHGPGAGIAVRKGDKELLEKFNKAIMAIRANGKYDEISKKYFKFDVYGD